MYLRKLNLVACSCMMLLALGCGDDTGVEGGTGGGGGGGSGKAIGKTCQKNADCTSKLCLFKSGASYGYCTKECESFTECPTFWKCKEVGNASGTYCVK